MPTVPVLNGPRVAPTIAPDARFSAPGFSPDAIRARQTENFGAALGDAGSQLGRVIAHELQRQNADAVQSAMNDVVLERARLTVDPEHGYANVRGEAALQRQDGKALDAVYGQRLQEAADGIGQRLTNPAQRDAFQAQTEQLIGQFREKVIAHAGREAVGLRVSTQAGTVDTAQKVMGLQWGDVDAVAQSQQAIKHATAELGRLQGWSSAETLSKTVDALSVGHQAVIAGALQAGKTDYAREYMHRVNAELTPAARLRLQGNIKQVQTLEQAQAFADDATARGLSAQDAVRQARERFSGDEEEAAVREVKTRFAEAEAMKASAQRAASDEAWKVIANGGGRKNIAPALWDSLGGAEQRQINDYLDAKWRRAKADAEGRGNEDTADGLRTYIGLMDMAANEPGKFVDLDLSRYAPFMTKAHMERLITARAGINRTDAKQQDIARVTQSTLRLLDQTIAAAGIRMSGKRSERETARADMFKSRLIDELTDASSKGALDAESARKIGLGLLREGIEQGSDGWFSGPTKKRVFEFEPGKSYVTKQFDDIPADIRTELVAEQRSRSHSARLTDEDRAAVEQAYQRGIERGVFK